MFTRKYMRSRAGFSLAELLVVLAIMAILLGLMVGSFGGTDAARLTTAGNSVKEALSLARQNSITQNAYTAFVVKVSSGGWASASPGDYSSFCLWQFTYTNSTDGTSSSTGTWTQISKWQQLPQGVFFDASNFTDGTGNNDNFLQVLVTPSSNDQITNDPIRSQFPSAINFQGSTITPSTATIFGIFQPDGSQRLNQEVRLRLVSGAYNGGVITYKGKMNGSIPANLYDIVILGDTGQVNAVRNNASGS